MKRSFIWYGIICFVSCFFVLSILGNKSQASDTDCQPGKFEHHIKTILELSDSQVEEIRIFRCENREDIQVAGNILRKAKKQFRQKVKGLSNETAVREAFQPVAQAMEDLAVYKTTMMQHMATILNEDQMNKMEVMHQMRNKRQRHAHFRHGDQPEEIPVGRD